MIVKNSDGKNILQKFGYPNSFIFGDKYWSVLLRPSQVTIGSLVLISNSKDTSLGELSEAQIKTFPDICKICEQILRKELGAIKFNYLALMMVDPIVHFHLIPRYKKDISFEGELYADPFWPGPTDISHETKLSEFTYVNLRRKLSKRAHTFSEAGQ